MHPHRSRWFVAALAFLILFPVCSRGGDWVYTVVAGDTLWDLSEKYLHRVGYWKQLQQINNVENPRRMPPGLRLRIPLSWIRSNPTSAEIGAVQGQALLFRAGDDQGRPAGAGDRIQLGDSLRTGADASVSVRFADGSVITLDSDSNAVFDHLSAYGETGMVDSRIRLTNGRAGAKAKPFKGPGSRFEIRTPSAVSAVRGTRYRAAVLDGEGSSVLEVVGGRVGVTGERRTRVVPAGYGTRVESGRPPLKPRPLLPAPVMDPVPETIERINWPLTWTPLSGAESYRVQVAAGPQFDTLLWSRVVSGPRAALPGLPDGAYHVRVRGIDSIGLEGLDREFKVALNARPEPPVPLQPQDGAVLREQAPDLAWSASADAARYRLQIATEPDFKAPLADLDDLTATRHAQPETAALGTYHWRLASIAADAEQGPWGPPRSVEVKPIPKAPQPQMEADESGILASWAAGAAGQRYRVQVAEKNDFQSPVRDETTDTPQLLLTPTPGLVRYLRIAVVEPDGYQGPWGSVQRIDPPPDNTWMLTVIPGILGILLLL